MASQSFYIRFCAEWPIYEREVQFTAHTEGDENRLAKIVRYNRPQGVRSRGRPKKRWKEGLNTAPSP